MVAVAVIEVVGSIFFVHQMSQNMSLCGEALNAK